MDATQHEIYHDKIGCTHESSIGQYPQIFKTDITMKDFEGNKLLSVRQHRANMTVLGGRLNILEKCFGIKVAKEQHLFLDDMIPNFSSFNTAGTVNEWAEQEAHRNDYLPTIQKYPSYASFNGSTMDTIEEDIFTENNLPLQIGNQLTTDAQRKCNTYDTYRGFNRFVRYWCIGIGGESTTPYVIHTVHPWETRLYRMVPFRFIKGGELTDATDKQTYFLKRKVELNDEKYTAYYAKRIDPTHELKVISKKGLINYAPGTTDEDGNGHEFFVNHSAPYVPGQTNHPWKSETSSVYVEFTLDINEIEFKEFYQATHGGVLTGARLSELGLINAFEYKADGTNGKLIDNGDVTHIDSMSGDNHDIMYAELFSKITHELVFLSSANSRRAITYRISV